jgi:hypothetical protein
LEDRYYSPRFIMRVPEKQSFPNWKPIKLIGTDFYVQIATFSLTKNSAWEKHLEIISLISNFISKHEFVHKRKNICENIFLGIIRVYFVIP